MKLIHLPPTGTDPHRWVNVEAIEWVAAVGCESVMRLRTGDTLRTSLSVLDLSSLLLGACGDFEPTDAET